MQDEPAVCPTHSASIWFGVCERCVGLSAMISKGSIGSHVIALSHDNNAERNRDKYNDNEHFLQERYCRLGN